MDTGHLDELDRLLSRNPYILDTDPEWQQIQALVRQGQDRTVTILRYDLTTCQATLLEPAPLSQIVTNGTRPTQRQTSGAPTSGTASKRRQPGKRDTTMR